MHTKNLKDISKLSNVNKNYDLTFTKSILFGLKARQKTIESKWLYDENGSKIFDEITELEEYYPTRAETEILRKCSGDLAQFISPDTVMIELGSGSSTKTRLVLDALPALKHYAPLDISKEYLEVAAKGLSADYPSIEVTPIVADFTNEMKLTSALEEMPKLIFFPGSTIGNFEVNEARKMLRRIAKMKHVAALVVGFDLVKDTSKLIRAYDDSKGVTAMFNMNLLTRINRELHADFDLEMFYHEARWNDKLSRIEMHLVSKCNQDVYLLEACISFKAGETIHTENSHKYTADSFTTLAKESGWAVQYIWNDEEGLFAVAVLKPSGEFSLVSLA